MSLNAMIVVSVLHNLLDMDLKCAFITLSYCSVIVDGRVLYSMLFTLSSSLLTPCGCITPVQQITQPRKGCINSASVKDLSGS